MSKFSPIPYHPIINLAESKSLWKFVVHHHPPYTSDENDYGDTYKELSLLGDPDVQPLIPLYEQYRVDIVFYGHIHDYERTWPIRQNRIDHHFCLVNVHANHLDFQAIDQNWAIFDTFALVKE